jgi:hypothetical protein
MVEVGTLTIQAYMLNTSGTIVDPACVKKGTSGPTNR